MKQTKQEIIKEINSKLRFLCWPWWMDSKGKIHKQRQASSGKLQAASA
jgi:hypothetical protein